MGVGSALLQGIVVDGRMGLPDQARGGLLHRLEVGAQAVPVQPLVHLLGAHQVADDAQGVSPGVQLFDGVDAALGDHPLPLGPAVGIGHFVRRRLHPLPGEVVGQPAGPQLLDRRLAVEGQRPLPVPVVPGLNDILVERNGVLLRAQQAGDRLLGRPLIGLVLPDDPEGVPQVHKNGVDLFFHMYQPLSLTVT